MKNFFWSTSKNSLRTYDNIQKIGTDQGDDDTTGSLLDNHKKKKYYTLIATDLSKQQKLDADPKAIQQANFTNKQKKLF